MTRALAAAAILACLVLAPSSRAAYDPVGGGTTKLVLEQAFASFLVRDGIRLSAVQGAKRKGSTFALPVSGGNLDPIVGKGEVKQAGALVFENGGRRVPLREIAIMTKHAPLIAKVGGGQLKVATAAELSFKREGFNSAFSARALRLTAKVATRLNKKLRPRTPFSAGQPLGSLVARARPKLTTVLESGRATLVFDSAFLAKLASRFVSVNPIFPAEHQGPTFTLPLVAGGAVAPDAAEGTLRTGGTVELLQLGGGQVFWQELWLDLGTKVDSAEVDLEPTPTFAGKIGRTGVFDAASGVVSADAKARTVSDSGLALTLQAATANALNEAFAEGQPLFAAGEAAGTLSFAAQGQ